MKFNASVNIDETIIDSNTNGMQTIQPGEYAVEPLRK